MTQLKQFLLWQLRDLCQTLRGVTVNKVCILLIGAQLAAILIATGKNDTATLDILALSIPVTLLVMFGAFAIEIQWDRFKREQERIVNTLKD